MLCSSAGLVISGTAVCGLSGKQQKKDRQASWIWKSEVMASIRYSNFMTQPQSSLLQAPWRFNVSAVLPHSPLIGVGAHFKVEDPVYEAQMNLITCAAIAVVINWAVAWFSGVVFAGIALRGISRTSRKIK